MTKKLVGEYYNYQGFSSTIITFDITKAFKKAKDGGGPISIINYNSTCDFHYEVGREYVVFAYDLGYGHYSADMCTKTASLENFKPDELKRLEDLSAAYVDDLYNYQDLMVLNKTSFNALTNENEQLSAEVENQITKIRILFYSFVAVVLVMLVFILLQKKKNPAGKTE